MRKMRRTAVFLALVMLLCTARGLAEPPVQTEGITVPVIEDLKKFEIPDNEAMALLRELTAQNVTVVTFDLQEPSLHEIFVEKVGGVDENA